MHLPTSSVNQHADIQRLTQVTFGGESEYDCSVIPFLEGVEDVVDRHVMALDPALEHQITSDEQMLDDLQSSLSVIQSTSPNDIMPASDFDWLFASQTPTSHLDQAKESCAWSFFIDSSNHKSEQQQQQQMMAPAPVLPSQRAFVLDVSAAADTPLDLLSSTALSTVNSVPPDEVQYRRNDRPFNKMEPRDLRAPSRRNSLPGGGGPVKDWPNSWYPQEADMRLNAEFFEDANEEVLMSENSYQVDAFDEKAKNRLLSICESAELPGHEAQQVYDMLSSVSVPTYNILTQLFFERFLPSNPFVHRETFSPSKSNPFLLGAVCAFGTFYTRTPKARNLGNVLIDLVHRAINLTTTRNNLHARSLSNIQALVLICIYFGNAGNRRFLENAEACRGAVVTMVRRCRLLDHIDEPALLAAATCSDVDNEERWKAWLHWETGRRTGWASFVADMELSSTWTLPPCFLLAELKTTLPSSEDLWEAPNAEVWASIYRISHPSPTIDRLHEAFSQSSLAKESEQLDLFQSLILAQSLSLMGQSIIELSHCKLARFAVPVRQEFVRCIEESWWEQYQGSRPPFKKKGASYRVILGFVVLRIHVDLHDLQAICGRRGSTHAKMARKRLDELFAKSPELSHSLARHCAEIVHLVRTHTIHIACLSTTTFYAVVFLYAYSRHQSQQSSQGDARHETAPENRIVLEKIGDLSSSKSSQRLLTTMSHFFLTQLAKRTWPTCKNLGSILSDMASRESSPVI
ncbi:hypothetical protein CBS101457_005006 [Exobasidium rhododendri]|nr:hypothetical protein CBS101457_005006 [Exobasidium rhododendri]